MNTMYFMFVLLVVPVFSRVRRQEILEDTPILPFPTQSKLGDDSQSIEVQNENAEKGIIDNKDAGVEEVVEYVDQLEPGSDPAVELDTSNIDDDVDQGEGLEGTAIVGFSGMRVIEVAPSRDVIRSGSSFGRNAGSNGAKGKDVEQEAKDQKAEDMRNKKNTFWIIFGISLGIMLLFLFACVFSKCKSQ